MDNETIQIPRWITDAAMAIDEKTIALVVAKRNLYEQLYKSLGLNGSYALSPDGHQAIRNKDQENKADE